jgi:hypothetical protein
MCMTKLFSFLMVALVFTALQLSTVSAQTGMPPMEGDPGYGQPQSGGNNPPMGNNSGMPPMDMSSSAIEDRCNGAPTEMERANCVAANNRMKNHDGPRDGMRGDRHGGGHNDAPPIDPRSGQPFTPADEVKYQKYADECEATNGLLSEGSAQALVAEGFTRIQLEKLCNESGGRHEGRNYDGPAGMPGTGAPGGAGPMTGGNR